MTATLPDPRPVRAFLAHGMPALLRRLHVWKGLRRDLHQDLIEDLHQELWLDYLEHADELRALTTPERHARWFRLLSQRHYQLRERVQRRCVGERPLHSLVQEPTGRGDPAALVQACPEADRDLLTRVVEEGTYMKNGRLNTHATARHLDVPPQAVRRAWEQLAEAAGLGDGFLSFWRRRLGEALLDLVACLVRDADLRRCQRRIRRIRCRLQRRPLPRELRHVLARYGRSSLACRRPNPGDVLADAGQLLPGHPMLDALRQLVRQQGPDLLQRVS